MGTERTLEAEGRKVLLGSVGTGTKEDESSAGRFWAAGFHRVTVRSRMVRVFKHMSRLIYLIFNFF
jgi:hypothetical protein